jgi:2-(1,2-epoxy-1,2-dihydrophenyl)acetyl-CoA isomerase
VAHDPVILARDGAVALIRLNRPDAGNTIDMALAASLEARCREAAEDRSVRAVLFTGEGKLFCGGGDISAFASAGADAGAFLFDLATRLHQSVEILAAMEKPLVVAVNGPAAGAGLSLAIAGDVVIAARSAHFSAAYGAVGLTPDGGMSWLLPRVVGLRRAQEIILTNRRIGADEAAAIGLVTRVVDDAALAGEALAAAHALAAGPVAALAGARALLAEGAGRDLAGQLRAEANRIAQAGAGSEAREGISAFLARRKPDFLQGQTQ